MTDKELAEKMKGAIRFVGIDKKQSGGWKDGVLEEPVSELLALVKEYVRATAPPEDLDRCPKAYNEVHQYFEIKKLHRKDPDYDAGASGVWKGREFDGVLVKCAFCKQSQELWEE